MEEHQDPAGDVKEALTYGHGEANSRLAPPSSNTEEIGLKWLALNGSELGAEYQQHLGLLERTEMVANMSNGTSASIEEINTYYFYETEQFAVLWILFVVIVLGNTAVLVTLFLNKNRKSRMNFFIKQLAIADLSVGLLSVLTDIVQKITISWLAGNVACKLIRFIQVWVTYASTYVLVALSIDRYDAITHPMNFSGCWKRARRLVAAAWGFSAAFSSPMLYLYEERIIQDQLQCWIDLGSAFRWQVYMCLVAASLFVIPAFIISACYVIIIRTIWSKGSMLGPAAVGGAAPRGAGVNGSKRKSPTKERRLCGAGEPAGKLSRYHSSRQGEDGQDDDRDRDRVRRLLVAVHHLRSAAGVRANSEDADKPRDRHLHPESGPAQLGRQPAHLLSLFHALCAHAEKTSTIPLASVVAVLLHQRRGPLGAGPVWHGVERGAQPPQPAQQQLDADAHHVPDHLDAPLDGDGVDARTHRRPRPAAGVARGGGWWAGERPTARCHPGLSRHRGQDIPRAQDRPSQSACVKKFTRRKTFQQEGHPEGGKKGSHPSAAGFPGLCWLRKFI